MLLFELLSDIMFDGKSFKKWYMGDADDVFEATALFILNYVVPLAFAAGVIWVVVTVFQDDKGKDKQKQQQPVPVNKTIIQIPKQNNNKATINYADAKKLLASLPVSQKQKTK